MQNTFTFLKFAPQKIKKLLLFLTVILFSIPFYSYATHIVGGELNYKCLGGNQYEIKLTVYRDCYNGVPPFDNPAAVGIFDVNNVLVTTVYLNFPGSKLLPPTVAQADACVQPGVGTNVCTEVAEYVGTVTLPPRVGGYQLAYQRCCRNPTINNIVNPGSTGATYYARIPDKAFSCNSTPLFKNFPSIFTCVNTPILFDNSATDADGDSIAYSFCAPLTGATGGNSQPQPPDPPPYTPVTWKAPYSASNLLGGVPLAIDPKTGFMTGTPNTLGQFVVGVCADEFRNGVLINTTKRDFQFNVINCRPDVVAAAANTITDCSNHTVTFTNNSTGNATFFWNFGVLPITTDTSSLKNPSYTYPSLGTYTVTLIAISARGPTCNDTLKNLVVVVDTCKPCAMTLSITKVDGTCGSGACTADTVLAGQDGTGASTGPNSLCLPGPVGSAELNTLGSMSPAWPSGYYWICPGGDTIPNYGSSLPLDPCPGGVGSSILDINGSKTSNPLFKNKWLYVCPCPVAGVCRHYVWKHPCGNYTFSGYGNAGSVSGTCAGLSSPGASGTNVTSLPTIVVGGITLPQVGVTRETVVSTATGIATCKGATITKDGNFLVFDFYVFNSSGGAPPTLGSATVTPAAGTAPYTYLWSPSGGTNATASNLSAGTYTVTVTDANGCVKTTSIIVDANSSMTLTSSQTPLSSCIATDGTGTVSATGGTGPYTYLWNSNPVQTTATATGLGPGTYTVKVNDVNGCNVSTTITISQPVVITAGSSITDAKCRGNNGTATVLPSGGSGTYTYSWSTSPVQTGVTATNLQAGYYVVTVTDAGGCSNTAGVTIANLSLALTSSSTTVNCAGSSNGTATVTATGGTPLYTYSWNSSPVQTGATATGLSGGTYIVKVTDGAGCIDSSTVTITEPSPLLAEPKNTSSVTCAGVPTGSAHADVSGGTSAFTYLWNNGQSTQNITGLSAGSYTVIVTDSRGCTASNKVDIIFPSVMSLTKISSDLICKGDNSGGATVSPLGGSPAYLYSWSTTPAQTSQSAVNLSAGTYTVIVTDSKGCTAVTTAVISEPTAIAVSTSSLPVGCTASNGSASATATGGTGTMSYSWLPSGQTTATATNLSAGTYTVIATDSNGCTSTATATVAPAPTASISGSSSICPGGSTVLTANGGGTYVWSANAGGATTTAVTVSPVSATTYTVTVTSGTCTTSATQVVTINPSITASISGTNTICTGGSTTLTASGGGTYLWSANAGTATTAAVTVTPGATTTYTVTVTSGSCTAMATQIVTVNSPPTATISGISSVCPGGSTILTASGGGTYLWSANTGSATTAAVTVSPASTTTYTVIVTSGSCTSMATQVVTINTPPTAIISGTSNICTGGSTILTASGGGTYLWSANAGTATTAAITVSPVSATTYTVTVTSGGCTSMATQVVTVNTPPTATITGTSSICPGESTVLTASGGGTYLWSSNAGNATTAAITVTPGATITYTVTVTSGGCTSMATQVITVNTPPPTTISGTGLICPGGTTTLTASGGGTYVWSANAGGATTAAITVTPGATTTYTVTVTSGSCTSMATQVVTVMTPTATITGTSTICTGTSTTLTATGGGNYQWSSNANTATTAAVTVSPASTTTYTVTVTVGTCTATATQEVIVNSAITANITGTSTICSGGNTILTASGGTTYSWSTGETTTAITVSPVSTSTYTVTVVSGSCTATATQVITVNTTPIPIISGSGTLCSGTVSTLLTASGGGIYQWSANAGSATTSAVTVTPGLSSTYTVTVSVGSCSASATFTVNHSAPVLLATSKTNVSCSGTNDGTATVIPSGGTPGYTYSWNTNPVQTLATAIGLSAGTYIVTVADTNGCSNTVPVAIIGTPNNVNADFNVSYKITCEDGVQAIFADSSSGATSWLWNFGDGETSTLQNPTHTFSYGQTLKVILIAMDAGCSDTMSWMITTNALNDYITLSIPNVFTPNDDGSNDCFLIGVGNNLEKCVQLIVYDRWGLKMFESTQGSCWDGTTTSGVPVSAGVYYYIVKINDATVHGWFSLFR